MSPKPKVSLTGTAAQSDIPPGAGRSPLSSFPGNPILPPRPGLHTRACLGRAGWMVKGSWRQEHRQDWRGLGTGALIPSGQALHLSASQQWTQWRVGPVWSELMFFASKNGIPEFYVNLSIFVDTYWFPEAQ